MSMTSNDVIREQVRNLIVDLAPNTDAVVRPGALLVEDLGFNSLVLMEMVFSIEDEFGLQLVDDGSLADIRTLGQAEDHILVLLAEQPEDSAP